MLLNMKRILERKVQSLIYDFAEVSDRARFNDDAQQALRSYKDKVRAFRVRFSMTPAEEQQSILHCYLDVVFKTIAKRGVIEINIQNRATSNIGVTL